MSFKDWSIRRKLATMLASILVLFVASTGLSIYQSLQQDSMLKQMMSQELVTERALHSWAKHVVAGTQRTAAITKTHDSALADYFAPVSRAAQAETAQLMEQIRQQIQQPQLQAQFAHIMQVHANYLQLRDDIIRLKNLGNNDEAERLFRDRFEPATAQYLSQVQQLTDQQIAHFQSLSARSKNARFTSIWQLSAFTALAVLLGIALSVVITRSITQPIARAQQAAREVAALDLSAPAQSSYSGDETGQLLHSLDEMRRTLSHTMGQVQQAARSISNASEQVAQGSNELSSRTEATAANLEQGASAIEQLSNSALQCADATRQAETLSRASSDATQRGYETAQHVQRTMQDIQASSQKIGDIIAVIDGIAFQTNILALNAAVEAARAGEQGRGFAVVAGEVRSLAGRSAQAAKEIRQLIDTNLQSVNAGNQQVHAAGAAMQDILSNVARVQDIVSEVNASTNEQSHGAAQINTAIAQLDQMTQQNAALVEESNAAAGHLHAQAAQLHRIVATFQLASSSELAAARAVPAQSQRPALPQLALG